MARLCNDCITLITFGWVERPCGGCAGETPSNYDASRRAPQTWHLGESTSG
jgi:hypothetical protein